MGKKFKRALEIVIIDDDADNRRQFHELIRAEFPNVGTRSAESVLAAMKFRSDITIIDVSAVCPLMAGNIAKNAYSPICSYLDRHPGTEIVICSGVGKITAESIIEEVRQVSGVSPHYGGWGDWEPLKALLTRLISPN